MPAATPLEEPVVGTGAPLPPPPPLAPEIDDICNFASAAALRHDRRCSPLLRTGLKGPATAVEVAAAVAAAADLRARRGLEGLLGPVLPPPPDVPRFVWATAAAV